MVLKHMPYFDFIDFKQQITSENTAVFAGAFYIRRPFTKAF
jgi:hypothetical protein